MEFFVSNQLLSHFVDTIQVNFDLSMQEAAPLAMALWWVDSTWAREVFCWLWKTGECWVRWEVSSSMRNAWKIFKIPQIPIQSSEIRLESLKIHCKGKWGQMKSAIKVKLCCTFSSKEKLKINYKILKLKYVLYYLSIKKPPPPSKIKNSFYGEKPTPDPSRGPILTTFVSLRIETIFAFNSPLETSKRNNMMK